MPNPRPPETPAAILAAKIARIEALSRKNAAADTWPSFVALLARAA